MPSQMLSKSSVECASELTVQRPPAALTRRAQPPSRSIRAGSALTSSAQPAAAAACDHRRHVDGVGGPRAEQAAVRMIERVHQRMRDAAQDARGHLRFGLLEAAVDRRRDVVERGQRLVRVVERAVQQDVHLGPEQHDERRQPLVDLFDQPPRFFEALQAQPVGDRQRSAVVGQRHVLRSRGRAPAVAMSSRRGRAVGPVGVAVQVALQVVDADQARQAAVQRRFDLALVLAQLGRDPGQAERGIHLVLRSAAATSRSSSNRPSGVRR